MPAVSMGSARSIAPIFALYPKSASRACISLTLQQGLDVRGDLQRCGQARRLDAIEIDEAGDAVIMRPLNDEVGRRLVRAGNLGPDARVARLQLAILQAGIILADC